MYAEEPKNKKYAGQLIDIPRGNQRLLFYDRLKPMSEKVGDPYLNIFYPDSIYFLSLFNLNEKRSLCANIPLKDLPLIERRTQHASQYIFDLTCVIRCNPSEDPIREEIANKVPLAFNRLKIGKYRKNTPGDLLLGAANVEELKIELMEQVQFLKRNLEDYPNNMSDILAIEDALNYYEIGILKDAKPKPADRSSSSSNSGSSNISADIDYLKIYTPPTKYWKDEKNERNYTKCYNISITCRPTNKYPYHIDLMNCYAPLKRSNNGLTPILMDQAIDTEKNTFDLTEGEWESIIDILNSNKKSALTLWYPEQRQKDLERRWKGNATNLCEFPA